MKKHLTVVLVLFGLVVLTTFPLVFNFNRYIPGFFSTDESYGNIWSFWQIRFSLLNNLSLNHTDLMSYPFGFDVFGAGYISYLWVGLTRLVCLFLEPVAVFNLQILFNLFLMGFFTYLCVLRINGGKVFTAFFSGVIFAFCPYQFARIWQHLGLTYNQWLPLCFLGLVLLKEKYSIKRVAFLLVSLLLLLSFDWTVMYLTFISLGCFLAYTLFYGWKKKIKVQKEWLYSDLAFIKRAAAVFLTAFVILSFQFIPLIKSTLIKSSTGISSANNAFRRPFEDLFAQSARPLSYFLPSAVHPVFGEVTKNFVGSNLYGISLTEHTLYLGWLPLILAFIAFKQWRKARKQIEATQSRFANDDFYTGFFIMLAVTAWLFSQPPWWKIGVLKIYMPSFFMYSILPMFRAYCRFGIVLMFAIAVLAGFGLQYLLNRAKSLKLKAVISVLACLIVLFEFWNWPPFKVIDVSRVPAVYSWLKSQPEGLVIAEYPLDANSPNELYKFFQTMHEKKIINGTIVGSYANKIAGTITELSDPGTAEVLKWMGVKYVIVHRDKYLMTDLIKDSDELNEIQKNPFLKLRKSFPAEECFLKNIMCVRKTGPVDVYEITAKKAVKPLVDNK